MNLPTITSHFLYYDRTDRKLPNFSGDYYMIIPKFIVIVDNKHEFDYHQSNQFIWTHKQLSIVRPKASLYFNKDSQVWAYYGKYIRSLKGYFRNVVTYPAVELSELPTNLTMTDNDHLFVLRNLLETALLAKEYCSMDSFLVEFGYDSSIASVRKGEEAYRQIQTIATKLSNYPLNQLINYLTSQGIE
jgi:hypothetical protein